MDKAKLFEVEATRIQADLDTCRAGVAVRDERIVKLQRELAQKEAEIVTLWHALADCENWIEAALRDGTPPVRPASFGQWRRPEVKEVS